jgi:CRISPR/Cas system-associated exonuclease Cas4 (RecB family)
MPIPPDFQFSQSSLQDFADCPRRFELRYILRQNWPAVRSEPVLEMENWMEQGKLFHQLVHQYLLGIPENLLRSLITQPEGLQWWEQFLKLNPLAGLPQEIRLPEYRLTAPFHGFRLVAQYDLLCLSAGNRAVIVDWKTSRHRAKYGWRERLQTRVYLYLLVSAGARLNNNQAWQPEQLEMLYWFPAFPHEPEKIAYSTAKYTADHEFLTSLVSQILSTPNGGFAKTNDEKQCRFCPYRSLCERGERAGNFAEDEDDQATGLINLDLDEIEELEF